RRSRATYPEVFPLSSLLLALRRLLTGKPARLAQQQGLKPVRLPGLRLPDSASPLLPCTAGTALVGAERARFLRRWLQQRAGRAETPPWEAALMLLVQHQVARSELELWSVALALPVQECLRAAAEEPRDDWIVEVYELIGREDLALMAGDQAVTRVTDPGHHRYPQ
ncbi:unnamed protein product, partial [Effrenium voratum]